ncbi:neural proliferation differentiation and control protein 1a isoform X2 [Gymnodraco acuticeps]|uniref:Neural proliferation differentiation and control protein 1a isoform X2 n=1 Tax=Gymnodraco acuticeps TaxID=8218 RepID=A0A6P8T9R1_GYMAC|nr:neural proliferation differentiation and control protein 1a isoform X2 [Gymnodraco acuticeps]
MMLLSSPRNGRLRQASLLLLLAAVLLCVAPVSASPPVSSKCPRHLDCAKDGRHFCRPGSSRCGPCLAPLEENEEGSCEVKKRHHKQGKVAFYPDLDEEIDFLHSVIEKQEVTEIKTERHHTSKHPAAVTSQKDDKITKPGGTKPKLKSQNDNSTDPRPTVSALPEPPTHQPGVSGVQGRTGPIAVPASKHDKFIVIIISLCVAVGSVAVILATVCHVKLQKESRLAQKVDYPAFRGGMSLPAPSANGSSMGDKNLAQNAQMYHYQHQKQQMLSMGNNKPEQKTVDTEVTSDEEEVGGDFTVYECPGLAPTGEMEVKNPLFDDSNLHFPENHK